MISRLTRLLFTGVLQSDVDGAVHRVHATVVAAAHGCGCRRHGTRAADVRTGRTRYEATRESE